MGYIPRINTGDTVRERDRREVEGREGWRASKGTVPPYTTYCSVHDVAHVVL